ncbi:MAG TPA: polysaccharide biosynthesis tyrosine autokinase [Anaerolineales bacterium]|nr:polysaccharide biosynthesis tyrosine autokinase [Anaerolineales bacterium]
MDNSSFSDDLRRYIGLLWHWAWLLALVTVLAAGAVYLISRSLTPVYEASTTLLINEAQSNQTTDYTAILTSERLARTYAAMMTKQPVLESVMAELGLAMDLEDLEEAVSVQPVRDTQLIEVTAEDNSPQRAADIANTIFQVFQAQNQALQASRFATSKESLAAQLDEVNAQVNQTEADLAALPVGEQAERDRMESSLAQYRQTYAGLLTSYEEVRVAEAQATSNVVQVEPAQAPLEPVRPRVAVNTLLAGLVGLMLAVGGIFLVEALDNTLRTPDDVTRLLGLPVLGIIADHPVEDGHLVALDTPRSPVAEAFRSLRTNLQFASVDRPLVKLLVTSPGPGEGKSTVAANLAAVLAQSGKRVTLLDADMRRPRVHKLYGLPNRKGLSELFVGPRINLNGVLQGTQMENLSALTTGTLPPNPSELLGSEKMNEIIAQVMEVSDVLVIDSPPVMLVTDSAVLSQRVDGILLVLRQGETNLEFARQSVEALRRVDANLLGVVLNGVPVRSSRYGYYRYQRYDAAYADYYGDDTHKPGRARRRGLLRTSRRSEPDPAPAAKKADLNPRG